jgi:hypothetical protein
MVFATPPSEGVGLPGWGKGAVSSDLKIEISFYSNFPKKNKGRMV